MCPSLFPFPLLLPYLVNNVLKNDMSFPEIILMDSGEGYWLWAACTLAQYQFN